MIEVHIPTTETERENVLSSNTPNFEKFYVQKVQESFLVPFCTFHFVPLFSQLAHFFSGLFPGCQSFPFWFLPASHYSTSRWLCLKREAPESVKKLRKEGHN